MRSDKPRFRSAKSYGKKDRDGFIHRSWMKAEGLPEHVFDGRPVIGICNTWSELTPCNSHLREIAEYVKRGVWEAGGLPLEFPSMSLGETQIRPTAMLFLRCAGGVSHHPAEHVDPADADLAVAAMLHFIESLGDTLVR